MNIMLNARAAVHLSNANEIVPACGVRVTGSVFTITDKAVTCFRCIRIIEHREAETDRIAYYAGLADQQDMDYSQAPAKDEIPAETLANGRCCEHAAMYHGARGCDNCRCTTSRSEIRPVGAASTVQPKVYDDRCCEHADMYHGARGCDTCDCNTPYDVMPVAGTVRVGRNVDTQQGRVSFRARLVEAVSLSWVLSVRPGAVITATNDEGTYWVYAQHRCTKARMLYVGTDAAEAAKAAAAYTVRHTNYVAMLAREAREHTTVTPTLVTRTVYRTDVTEGVPSHDIDARTGLPVVPIFGCRYVIGCEQYDRFGSGFVEFWSEPAPGSGSSTVFRASGTSSPESPAAKVWEAHRRIRNV